MSYKSTSSAMGRSDLQLGNLMFAVSDVPPTISNYEDIPGLLAFPAAVSAVVPFYNLPNVATLVLDGAALGGIFGGWISSWNDPIITALNPSQQLPAAPIKVIMSGKPSGMQYILSKGLSNLNSTYAAVYGASETTPVWQNTSRMMLYDTLFEMVDAGKEMAYSIGYASYRKILDANLGMVTIRKTSVLVDCSTSTIHNAYLESELGGFPHNSTMRSWPLIGTEYFFMRARDSNSSCVARRNLVDWMVWWYQSDENAKIQSKFAFAIIPAAIQDSLGIVDNIQNSITCGPDNALVYPPSNTHRGTLAGPFFLSTHLTLTTVVFGLLSSAFNISYNTLSSSAALQALNTQSADVIFGLRSSLASSSLPSNAIALPSLTVAQVITTHWREASLPWTTPPCEPSTPA